MKSNKIWIMTSKKRTAVYVYLDEMKEMIEETITLDVPYLFISSVAQQGIQPLKDKLWQMLNPEG